MGSLFLRHVLIFNRIGFSGLLLLLALVARAQPTADDILATPEDLRIRALWDGYAFVMLQDTGVALGWMEELEKEFRQRDIAALEQQVFLIRTEYQGTYRRGYEPEGIQFFTDAIETASRRRWPVIEAELLIRKGILFNLQGNHGPAFENMQRGYRRLKALGLEKSASNIRLLEAIALAHFKFGNYEEATHFLREALTLKPQLMDVGDFRKTANTLGMCYIREQKLDSAIFYFDMAHAQAVAVQDTFWAALANGNKAYALYLQERYDEAFPLLEADFKTSDAFGEYASAVNAAMQLATIHLRRGEIDKTRFYLAYGERHIDHGSSRAMYGFYQNLAEISRLQGNYADAFRYVDSFIHYKNLNARENDIQVINHAKLKVEVEQYAHQLDLLEQQRSRQILIRNGMIVILGLAAVIAFLLVRQQRARRQREQQLAALREQAARDELEASRDQLRIFTHALREKNELVEAIRGELESLQTEGRPDERTENLHRLLSATILTEDDWKEFRILFDKVYPGFFNRLRQRLSDLTPAETRLLALTKLQLTPKEMAGMLGISYDAIKKTRQRLRKKIDLPEEGGLDELVDMI